jgi:hypothetical protein
MLFGAPKPPKIDLADVAAPPPPPPPLPPPAKEDREVQEAAADVARREKRRGRASTILTSPMGVPSTAGGPRGAGLKTRVGQ